MENVGLDTFSVVIIKQNDLDPKSVSFDKDEIKKQFESHLIFENIIQPEMMDMVVSVINLTNDQIGATTMCYEDGEIIYQICHLNMEDNGKVNDKSKKNGIASLLTIDNVDIYGDCVLICSRIMDNFLCKSETITMDSFCDLVLKKRMHTGVKVYPDGKLEQFTFIDNPSEVVGENIDKCQWIETQFLKFTLLQLIQHDPDPDVINRTATKLSGRFKVHGPTYFISAITKNDYENLTVELFEKMLKVADGDLRDRELKDDEKDDQKQDDLPIIMNRHCVLNKRLDGLKKVCQCCKEEIVDSGKLCLGCYRVWYHDDVCQKKDWEQHQNLCLYKKLEINKILKK